MSVSKPVLGLLVGGGLGLADGLSGFFEPSLAPVMTSVITFSMLKGLIAGMLIGLFSQKVRSMPWGLLAGLLIAGLLSLIVIWRAGMALFWDIMLPGMILGLIVGFLTQKFGRKTEPASAAGRSHA
jgi:hypothetical protein